MVQVLPGRALDALFGATGVNPLPPSWNRAPMSPVAFIAGEGQGRQVRVGRWGLVPAWWKTEEPLPLHLFNARCESLMESQMFRSLVRTQRCVVPVDGWYAWSDRRPFYFRARSGRVKVLRTGAGGTGKVSILRSEVARLLAGMAQPRPSLS